MRTSIFRDKSRLLYFCATALILAIICLLNVIMFRPNAMAALSEGIIYRSQSSDEILIECVLSWDSSYTAEILDILRTEDARITFAVTGELAGAHPDLIKRIASDGHTLLTCGMTFFDAQNLSVTELTKSILQSVGIIEDAGGVVAGFYNSSDNTSKVQRAAKAAGLPVYSCTYDLLCGRGSAQDIKKRAEENASGGSIISVTPTIGLKDSLSDIIRLYRQRGFAVTGIGQQFG